MKDLNKLPYAEWLEQSLQNVISKPVQAICIMTKFASTEEGEDDIGTGYYNCSVADKLVFAGFLQQDAMLDSLRANGYIPDDEDDEIEEEESDGEA